jgi:hypothetical protein
MPVAASLSAAADLAVQNAYVIFADAGRILRTQLTSWLASLKTNVPTDNAAKRTVTNWIAIGRPVIDALPTVKGNEKFYNANEVGVLVYRTCQAAAAALAAGRITAGEGAAILASYNALWV